MATPSEQVSSKAQVFRFCRNPVWLGVVLWLLWFCGAASADDKSTQQPVTVVKTKEGLHFTLPPDWPVEKRDGVVAPIPIEEYLSRKFAAMEARLKALEQQVAGFDLRLRVVEEAVKDKKSATLKATESSAP